MNWLSPDQIPTPQQHSAEDLVSDLERIANESKGLLEKLDEGSLDKESLEKLTEKLRSLYDDLYEIDEQLNVHYGYNEDQDWVLEDQSLKERRDAIDETLLKLYALFGD